MSLSWVVTLLSDIQLNKNLKTSKTIKMMIWSHTYLRQPWIATIKMTIQILLIKLRNKK